MLATNPKIVSSSLNERECGGASQLPANTTLLAPAKGATTMTIGAGLGRPLTILTWFDRLRLLYLLARTNGMAVGCTLASFVHGHIQTVTLQTGDRVRSPVQLPTFKLPILINSRTFSNSQTRVMWPSGYHSRHPLPSRSQFIPNNVRRARL